MEVREHSSATGPPQAEPEGPSAKRASQSSCRSQSGPGTAQRGRLPGRENFRRVRHPQAPPLFGSQALTVKPPALNRQNSEHYRGVPPIGSMAQQSAQLPHKEKVVGANPPRAPSFSKRGRAANAARCKRDALTGYEGASPSASTICIQPVESDGLSW